LLARYIRAKDVNDKIYSMLLERLQEARITEASKVGDIHIVDLADIPHSPIKPNKTRNIILGVILGLALGIGLAFFRESLDTSIKSQNDVENFLHLPVLATIPTINSNGSTQLRKKDRHQKESYVGKLLTNINKNTPIYEAYRTLQLNFNFINYDRLIKNLLITSAGAGDGKTISAINMAQLFSNSNIKTLLIDCDFRRPMVHKILNLKQGPGLSNVLINQSELEKVIQQPEGSKLQVLTCGTIPPNPSDILDTQSMKNLLSLLRNLYDLIILDAPPTIAVTDSMILGSKVDGVCFVIKSGKTSFEAANHAKQILEKGQSNIVGTILNDVNLKNTYDYYKDYYYYSQANK